MALIEAVLAESEPSGLRLTSGRILLASVPTLARANRWDESASLFDQAIDAIQSSGEAIFEAVMRQQHGEFILARDGDAGAAAAEASFVKALEVARAQDARWWELRAAVSLTRLWHSQGKRREARELLEPIYGWFTEGFQTLDLKEARGLLP